MCVFGCVSVASVDLCKPWICNRNAMPQLLVETPRLLRLVQTHAGVTVSIAVSVKNQSRCVVFLLSSTFLLGSKPPFFDQPFYSASSLRSYWNVPSNLQPMTSTCTRTNRRLFSLPRLRTISKIREILIRDMLLADDAVLAAHPEEQLQRLVNTFSKACQESSLTISQTWQAQLWTIRHQINNSDLGLVHEFISRSSTVSDTLARDPVSSRIGRAATMFAMLTSRVWSHNTNIKSSV